MTGVLVFGQAFRMIVQDLQNTAISHAVTATFRDHPFEFRLQRFQPPEALLNLFQLALRNRIGVGTGLMGVVRKLQKFANGIKRKSKLARMTNERQPVQIGRMITPLPTLGTPWLGQKPDLFVIADGLHLGSGA